jgi:hypothetical protein
VVVELRDSDGTLFDRQLIAFQVGSREGEINNLSAIPDVFEPGEEILLSVDFHNTGTSVISGTIMLELHHAINGLIEAFRFSIQDFQPGDSTLIEIPWDSSGCELGGLQLIAYAQGEGMFVGPVSLQLTALGPEKVFLPFISR